MTLDRDPGQVAVFDADPANFLKGGKGIILPVNGVVVECDAALAAQVEDLLNAGAKD